MLCTRLHNTYGVQYDVDYHPPHILNLGTNPTKGRRNIGLSIRYVALLPLWCSFAFLLIVEKLKLIIRFLVNR